MASLPPEFRPQTLRQYIASYGEIARDKFRINTDWRTATQGVVVRPEHRRAPVTVRPWTNFEQQQAILWDALLDATIDTTFPCYQHVVETGRELPLVDCEAAVHLCDTDLLHKPVSRVLDVIGKDQGVIDALSRALVSKSVFSQPGLELGDFVFSTHRNQLNDLIPQIAGSKRTRDGNLIESSSDPNAINGQPEAQETQVQEGEVQGIPSQHITHEFVEQQFRAGPTDGFCNFKGAAENIGSRTRRTLFAYELKAPHKLPWSMIERAGLASNTTTLDLRRDVWERSNRKEDTHDEDAMSHDGEGPGERAGEGEDALFPTTGVITQLYDFMIRREIRYGYISTSDYLMFLRLAQHTPSVVEYHTVQRPQEGSSLPPEQMLPTARVMLFALLSLADNHVLSPKDITLIQRNNHRWPVIRASTEGTEAFGSAHESGPGRESTADKSFHPSTASPASGGSAADDLGRADCTKRKRTPEEDRAAEPGDVDASKRPKLQDANDQIDDPAKPSLDARSLPTPPTANSSPASLPGKRSFHDRTGINGVPYCTTKCILGVVMRGPMDAECPNTHGDQHPSPKVFRQKLLDQLDPYSSDIQVLSLWESGSTGSLFKVRLASLGYVLVAKAAPNSKRSALHREEYIYKKYLRPAQEIGVVPPCLGTIDLPFSWGECETTGRELTSCLLLGCAPGMPTLEAIQPRPVGSAPLTFKQEPAKQAVIAAVGASMRTAFEVVHRLGILHGDAALRNTVTYMPGWSTNRAQVVLVDFEHAMSCRTWWEKLQKRKARMSRKRKEQQPQQEQQQEQQVTSTADQQARFQAACRREMVRCLGKLEEI